MGPGGNAIRVPPTVRTGAFAEIAAAHGAAEQAAPGEKVVLAIDGDARPRA